MQTYLKVLNFWNACQVHSEYIYFLLLPLSNRKYVQFALFRIKSWNNGMRCRSFLYSYGMIKTIETALNLVHYTGLHVNIQKFN